MWLPTRLEPHLARYLAIVRALEKDIEAGSAPPGEPLAPQREMAYRLGVSVGTVVRAYSVAQQRGLVSGEVGRGTFVADPAMRSERRFFGDGETTLDGGMTEAIDLGLNVPPLGRQAERLGQALRSLASSAELPDLLRYGPHRGASRHREAIAGWVGRMTAGSLQPNAERVVVTGGAQHAMSVLCSALVAQGDTILTESATYAGIKSIAGAIGARIHGVEMDDGGLIPSALEAACRMTGARILYLMPTVQNPTGATMPEARRAEIAEVAERCDLTLVEDDVYGFLAPDAPAPMATRLPGRTCYVSGFSKVMAPGLRVGFAIVPERLVPRAEALLRAAHWMTAPLMVEIVARWIGEGTAAEMARERREEARIRCDLAARFFPSQRETERPRFHLWLPMESREEAESVAGRARSLGVVVTPPDAVMAGPAKTPGIRVCLGASPTRERLEEGLRRLKAAVDAGSETMLRPPSLV